jgi:hypothetical protein
MTSSNTPYQTPGWGSDSGPNPKQATNGLAVASLVLGILWLCWLGSVLAVIFGHVALAQIKKTGAAGRGLAIAGLVLGYAGVGSALLVGVLTLVGGEKTTTSQGRSGETDAGDGAGSPSAQRARESGIGTPVRDGKFEFTVTKTSTASQVGNSFLNKKAQGEYVLVNVKVKNTADQANAFSGTDQKLTDGAGHTYSADDEAAIYLEDSKSLYEEINPGNQVKGVVLFDVPRATKPAAIELHDSAFSGGVKVSLR